MNTTRTAVAIVGVLFIIGTVSGVLSLVFIRPALESPDDLVQFSAKESQVIVGSLLILIMGVACAGVGLSLYPILRKYNEGLAIGAAGFRSMEGVLEIIGAVGVVSLLALSQEFVKAVPSDMAYFQTLGTLIKAGSNWVNNVAVLLSWCIAALMYYSVFYQYRLVPRWLSGWGLAGITLSIIASFLVLFRVAAPFGTLQVVANVPIALQEMVFAVWLIVKGVNSTIVPSGSAKEFKSSAIASGSS